ncbi:MAG: helix-turn-helix transcriptional regulator [Acetatifactor sp.]|nr:helix-turn-helix transcriptional regulator [Acetatifactor sp.]
MEDNRNQPNLRLLLSRRQSLTLRQRMMIYLIFMILASIGLVTLFSIVGGIVWSDERQLTQVLENQLDRNYQKMEKEMEGYVGYSFNLSKQLSHTIELQMGEEVKRIEDFNDSPQKLLELQQNMFNDLNTAILSGGSNGVYAIIDATVNTDLENATNSRSGLYLRLVNINSNVAIVPQTILFRGNPLVARENGLELHNRWDLEFHVDLVPDFWEPASKNVEPFECIWTDKMQLTDTWEDVILSCVPIRNGSGEFLGICGMELNEIHFSSDYDALNSDYGSIVTVMAPVEDGKLHLDQGMLGNPDGTWLKGSEILEFQYGKKLLTYRSDSGNFFGLQKKLSIRGSGEKEWMAAVLVPMDRSLQLMRKNLIIRILAVATFVICMLLLALYLSRKFVQPILNSFDDIKEDRQEGTAEIRIAEIEELKEFIKSKNQKQEISELPKNIEDLLSGFQKRTITLTPAERSLLKYYSKDYSLEEIAEAMFISIGTAKKHNTNMNRKLEISSRSQLMVYIDLFRRCDRLEDIIED